MIKLIKVLLIVCCGLLLGCGLALLAYYCGVPPNVWLVMSIPLGIATGLGVFYLCLIATGEI